MSDTPFQPVPGMPEPAPQPAAPPANQEQPPAPAYQEQPPAPPAPLPVYAQAPAPVYAQAPAPVYAAAPQPAYPYGHAAAVYPTPRRKRRWPLAVAAILIALGLVGLSVYLTVVSLQWRTYASDLEAAVDELRTTAAHDRAARDAIAEHAAVVESQLETANARITELANEEANAVDGHDVLTNYLDAMISCAEERQVLIDVLTDSSLHYPGKTNAQVEREITAYCNSVITQIDEYKASR